MPFFDFSRAWNHQIILNPNPSALASFGLGLRFQMSDRLTVRIDFGIPPVKSMLKRTLQEKRDLFFYSY